MRSLIKILLVFFLMNNFNSYCQCFVGNGNLQGSTHVYFSSGNNWIDQTYNNQNQYLSSVTKLKVKYGFYDDSTGPNAFAMNSSNYNLDGETYFGLNLINKYINDNGQEAYNNILWILSHEYSHVIQFKYGRIWQDVKQNELQADFMAGSITLKLIIDTLRNKYKNFDDVDNEYRELLTFYIDNAKNFFNSIGDTQFGDPQHHGTPQERMNAYYSGITSNNFTDDNFENKDGSLNLDLIWQESKDYVNSLNKLPRKQINEKYSDMNIDQTVKYINSNIKRVFNWDIMSVDNDGKLQVYRSQNDYRYIYLKDVNIIFDSETGTIDFECIGSTKCMKHYEDIRNSSSPAILQVDDNGNYYSTRFIDRYEEVLGISLNEPISYEKSLRTYKALVHLQTLLDNSEEYDPFKN